MEPRDQVVRKFVLDFFLEKADAPTVEEIARDLGESGPMVRHSLQNLEVGHHLKLLEGTFRILMAFPFSAIATPFRVTRANAQRYFANCAWDSIAFHPLLREAIGVDSFCDRCGQSLQFDLRDGKPVTQGPPPRVRLGLPAGEWWKDITRACANTMTFLCSNEIPADGDPAPDPGVLTIEDVLQLSEPIYGGKLELGYKRPPKAVLQSVFSRLGLTGPYWTL